jgi:serine/threonine-protein kinase
MQLTFATGELSPVLATDFSEAGGRISPDGRWLAYQSDESGTFEIYVRPFPEVERSKVQISAGGGTQPVWRRDGNELFFRRPDGAVMAVAITGRTPALQAGPAAQVVGPGYYTFDTAHTYDVSADGTRFYMIKDTSADVLEAPTLTVVQHFFEELKRLVP